MEELQPYLHGAHEADSENPGETFTAGQRNIIVIVLYATKAIC